MNFDSNWLQPMSHLGHDKEAVKLPNAVLVLMLLCTLYCYLRDAYFTATLDSGINVGVRLLIFEKIEEEKKLKNDCNA